MNETTQDIRRESYEKAKPKFSKQEQLILDTLTEYGATCDELYNCLKHEIPLLTSLRRAVTTLCDKGKVEPVTLSDGTIKKRINSLGTTLITVWHLKPEHTVQLELI